MPRNNIEPILLSDEGHQCDIKQTLHAIFDRIKFVHSTVETHEARGSMLDFAERNVVGLYYRLFGEQLDQD